MVIATSLETTCNRGCFNLFFCSAPNGGILPLIRSARWSRRCSRRDDPSTGGWPLQPELWLINGHSMAATQDGGIGRWLFTKEVWDGIPCGDGYFFVFSMMFSWSVSLNYFHNWRQWEEEEQKISRNQLISWVSRHWNMPRKRLTNEQHRYDGMIVIFPSHVITLLHCRWHVFDRRCFVSAACWCQSHSLCHRYHGDFCSIVGLELQWTKTSFEAKAKKCLQNTENK